MPADVLSRIPMPSLRVYTALSVLLVAGCVYYSFSVTSDPSWKQNVNVTQHYPPVSLEDVMEIKLSDGGGGAMASEEVVLDSQVSNREAQQPQVVESVKSGDEVMELQTFNDGEDYRTTMDQFKDMMSFMGQEAICIWTLINMAYCCLILLGRTIQRIVFGELRISEQQHMKDKFWNFVFYKFIFVFGVVNVQYLNEVILWVSWFSVLGFLHLLSQLCKDRFEYLSFSPTTPGWSHFRLVALLSAILTLSGIMFVICIGVGLFGGINTFAFMAAECVLLGIRTSHVLTRYTIFLYDMRHGGINNESVSWDKRGSVSYYIELVFEVAALLIDLLHHLHMLFWSNIFLSMASLVIIMQLRYLVHEIQRKFKRHRNYLWVLNHMEKSYPLASQDDLSQNSDNCAICWEKMDTARKLPCGHLFHNSCLQSWLEQDTSCPTCRLALSVQSSVPTPIHPNIAEPEPQGRANNHFFRFNGSRYVSWLPNFSVEVTHINNLLRADVVPQTTLVTHTSQMRNMARQVQQMFPRYPISVIIADLQVTRSMELTADNILEGRLIIPAHFQADDEFEETNAAPGAGGTTSSGSTNSSTSQDTLDREGTSYGFRANPANDYYVNPSRFAQFTDSSNSSTPASSPERESSPTTSGFDSGYEIERNSNIFGNQNDLLRDESWDLEDIPLGDRFSKSSNEREKILARRKEMMLAQARKRFLDKNKSQTLNDEGAAGQSGDAQGARHRSKISISE